MYQPLPIYVNRELIGWEVGERWEQAPGWRMLHTGCPTCQKLKCNDLKALGDKFLEAGMPIIFAGQFHAASRDLIFHAKGT